MLEVDVNNRFRRVIENQVRGTNFNQVTVGELANTITLTFGLVFPEIGFLDYVRVLQNYFSDGRKPDNQVKERLLIISEAMFASGVVVRPTQEDLGGETADAYLLRHMNPKPFLADYLK